MAEKNKRLIWIPKLADDLVRIIWEMVTNGYSFEKALDLIVDDDALNNSIRLKVGAVRLDGSEYSNETYEEAADLLDGWHQEACDRLVLILMIVARFIQSSDLGQLMDILFEDNSENGWRIIVEKLINIQWDGYKILYRPGDREKFIKECYSMSEMIA